MSIGSSIARNTLIQFIGKGVTTVLGFLLLAYLTRQLGVASYGNYITALTFAQFFGIFANFGIDVYVLKRLSVPKEDEERLVAEAGTLRLVTGLFVMLFAALVSFTFPYSPELRFAILIALFSVLAQTLNSYFVTILQARLRMKYAVTSEIIGRAVTLILSVVFVMMGKGLFWVIGAQVIGSLLNLLITIVFAGKIVKIGFRWNTSAWSKILKEALPISISAMLGYLYFKLDTIFLSIIPLSGGLDNAEAVGIYGSAYKVLEILLLIPAIFLGSVFPVMSRFLESNDKRVGVLLQRSVEVMALFGFPVTILLLIGAPQIIRFVAGDAFMEAVIPLRILSLAILINYFSTVFTYTALTLNKQGSLIKIYLAAVVWNATANYLFIPEYTYRAAAWVTFGTEVIVLVFPFIVCVNALKFKPSIGILGRIALAGLTFAIVLWMVRDASLLILVVTTLVVYPILLWLYKALQPRELVALLRGSV